MLRCSICVYILVALFFSSFTAYFSIGFWFHCLICVSTYIITTNHWIDRNGVIIPWKEMLFVWLVGLYLDARAALDYLFTRSDVCQQRLIVFGRSLGGSVALRVCSEADYADRVAAVIVENTFTSIFHMTRSMFDFRILHYLPEWCYKNKVGEPLVCLLEQWWIFVELSYILRLFSLLLFHHFLVSLLTKWLTVC